MASPTKADYDAAVAKERAARNGIYVSAKERILEVEGVEGSGFLVNNLTPHSLSLFAEADSPFIYGGPITLADAVQFIALLQDDPNPSVIASALLSLELEEIADEIAEFVELTFMDAPGGVAHFECAPIASGVAWIEYRMLCEPFHWDYDTRTKNTPLRRIYQLLRCQDREAGQIVINKYSGRVEGDSLAETQRKLEAGEITPEQIAEAQARAVYEREGVPYVPKPKSKATTADEDFKVIGGEL